MTEHDDQSSRRGLMTPGTREADDELSSAARPVITIAEAARIKGVDWATIRRAVDRGEIRGYASGKVWLVYTESVLGWTKTGHGNKKPRRGRGRPRKELPP